MTTRTQVASGCLFGLALGDALAEFIRDTAAIEAHFGPGGPREPAGNPAPVTDDTQMTLAVGEALARVSPPYTAANAEMPLRQAFIAWMVSPDNTRAPGMTCMTACRNLMQGETWQKATVVRSKGCGANMRVAPVGLLPGIPAETRAALAQFQAALTHGHPTGLAASDLTAFAVADLARGDSDLASLPSRLIQYAETQRRVYHFYWLGPLWEYWNGCKKRSRLLTSPLTRAWLPEKAGSRRKRSPRACSASSCFLMTR
jgi:ADP-ribosylglycohydrolase